MVYSLAGEWQADIGDGRVYSMRLPGTLDENQIGGRDMGMGSGQLPTGTALGEEEAGRDGVILTRFTRKHQYEGLARLTRRVSFDAPSGQRIFLEVERARCLRLLVDGVEIPNFRESSISTPYVFEVTDCWTGEHEITLLSDNSYPGLPRDAIVYSSAATDETQTNWNGVLGYLRLRTQEAVFVESVAVYPAGSLLNVKVRLSAAVSWKGQAVVRSKALAQVAAVEISAGEGMTEVVLENLALVGDVRRWDEYEGNLYDLTVDLVPCEEMVLSGSGGGVLSMPAADSKTVTFGVRDFGANAAGQLTLNGRAIFLRGEANCAVFPETGYCPMSEEAWCTIWKTYKAYGVNCVRFHSHCPPEAAFAAADREGMLMQPELSNWNPKDAFETDESFAYYRTELQEILRMLANHPSFVMLTFGNELHTVALGDGRMEELLVLAHELDSTRLFAKGSNAYYGLVKCGGGSDFYTAPNYFDQPLRGIFPEMTGHINRRYPSATVDYGKTMEAIRKDSGMPVFSFEVGQFEILPDFGELEDFQGISDPANLRHIKERVEGLGLSSVWKKYVEATGELSRIGYREEIEAAMRTEGMSGISLLGLQDFPGQGTALVGMLNSHLQPKPYDFARPEAFRAFFAESLPLVLLQKYTYENTETLCAEVRVVNFGKRDLDGVLCYRLAGESFRSEGIVGMVHCPVGARTEAGCLEIPLAAVKKPVRLDLTVTVGAGREALSNSYPVWVYPPVRPICPAAVYETACLDEKAKAVLAEGGSVYLTPPSTKEALPSSIQAQFTTDFWSVGTFSKQEGGMGQLIDAGHPIFRDFPTEFHTNWQWWAMASRRAVILPRQYGAIITEMDSYAYLRPMAKLLECRCGGGKLLFSTMGLQDLQNYPEARALLSSIYRYLGSPEFEPEQEIAWEVLRELVKDTASVTGKD